MPESGQKRATEEPSLILQDKTEPVMIPKGIIVTDQGTNGTQNDSIVPVNEPSITHARTAAALASLLKEKANSSFSSTCTPARVEETFRELFGVNAPVGSDPAAVGVMIARRKSGKLDNLKSPLAYLASLAGKVQPIVATQTPPAFPSVTENRMSHADMGRIDSIWDAMDHSQYKEKAMAKDQTGKKYPVPVELLARSIFNAEMMAQQGGQYGKGN
jgi:hypothetical protein